MCSFVLKHVTKNCRAQPFDKNVMLSSFRIPIPLSTNYLAGNLIIEKSRSCSVLVRRFTELILTIVCFFYVAVSNFSILLFLVRRILSECELFIPYVLILPKLSSKILYEIHGLWHNIRNPTIVFS